MQEALERVLDPAPLVAVDNSLPAKFAPAPCVRPGAWRDLYRRPLIPDRTCSVEDCEREYYARDWCYTHYRRNLIHGTPRPDVPIRAIRYPEPLEQDCSVEACEEVAVSRGWCRAHYNRWYRTGSPTLPNRPPGPACVAPFVRGPRKGQPATGTNAGWRRHRKAKEDPCSACHEGRLAYVAKWRAKNKDKTGEYHRRRLARKAEAVVVPFTDEQLQQRLSMFGFRCYLRIRCDGDQDIELDHVIPLTLGGPHCLANLRPICRSCNATKGGRTLSELEEAAQWLLVTS